MSLFGFDMITNSETRKHAVIDVNYFPSNVSCDLGSAPCAEVISRGKQAIEASQTSTLSCATICGIATVKEIVPNVKIGLTTRAILFVSMVFCATVGRLDGI